MEAFATRVARATGRAFEHVEADLERGRWLDAEEALEYGIIDEIERREAPTSGTERPKFGFA
jgi:ATP-dependent protease ClpP protease subunit